MCREEVDVRFAVQSGAVIHLCTCVYMYSMFMNMQVVNKIAGGRSSRAATAHTNAFEDDDGGSGFCARAANGAQVSCVCVCVELCSLGRWSYIV